MALRREYNFELQHLRYFIAVAEKENCSISEVASELHMAQSNLSQQIKDLEKKLGNVTLFDRKKRPLRLTQTGQEFLKQARLILAQVDRAIETATLADRGQIGELIVGFNSSVSNSVLPDILIGFQTRFPNVKLVLQERTAYSLIKGLETEQIDVGLMHWSALNHQNIGLCVD